MTIKIGLPSCDDCSAHFVHGLPSCDDCSADAGCRHAMTAPLTRVDPEVNFGLVRLWTDALIERDQNLLPG